MSIQCSKDLRSRLRSFVRGENPEEAFREIADELGGLIYHAALRQSGDATISEEVTQKVFLLLARQAGKLVRHPEILAWVHRTTRNKVLEMLRADARRKKREMAAMEYQEESESVSPSLLEELDESLDRLSGPEREVILLKFFEGQTYPMIASQTGRSESAEKMRVKRALEKMAGWLGKKGVTLSVAGLTTVLSTEMGKAAPVGLGLTGGALSNAVSSFGSLKIGLGVSLLVTAGFVIPISSALEKVEKLESQRAKMEEGRGGNDSERRKSIEDRRARGRSLSSQVPFVESQLPISALAWRYEKADSQYDQVTMSRVELVLEEMDLAQLKEFGRRLNSSYPDGFMREVVKRMKVPQRVDFLMEIKLPRRGVAREFERMELEEAGEWLVGKAQRGELISKSHRYAYRKQLWGSFYGMLKSRTTRDEVAPDPRHLEFVRIGTKIAPLVTRPLFEKLESEIADVKSQEQGGGE